MKRAIQIVSVAVVSVGLSLPVVARTITHGGTSISMDFVTIGDAGNAGDGTNPGGVSYTYRIGKYEVSKNQWDSVVAASGIDLLGDPGQWSGNQPVANISWYDAAMFCNWLTSGDVRSGAYTINASGEVMAIDRAAAVDSHGTVYVIPTEDEWYKAAYYDGSNYYDYPNESNTSPDGINFAGDTQFDFVFKDPYQQGVPNAVDNAGDLGPYDTMGQGGNIWEWNETVISPGRRGVRGASFDNTGYGLHSSQQGVGLHDYTESYEVGFRVAEIPEPATLSLLVLGGLAVSCRRRNQQKQQTRNTTRRGWTI